MTKPSSIKWHGPQGSLIIIQPDCHSVNDIRFIDENLTAGVGTTKPEQKKCLTHCFERTHHDVERREHSGKVELWDVPRSSAKRKVDYFWFNNPSFHNQSESIHFPF
jgi:hypothetical protein